MIEPSLNQLEQEVQAARGKLASEFSTLRSPATAAEFTDTLKQEAMEAKHALLDKAKTSVQYSIESLIEDIKARAAPNAGTPIRAAPGTALSCCRGVLNWRVGLACRHSHRAGLLRAVGFSRTSASFLPRYNI